MTNLQAQYNEIVMNELAVRLEKRKQGLLEGRKMKAVTLNWLIDRIERDIPRWEIKNNELEDVYASCRIAR